MLSQFLLSDKISASVTNFPKSEDPDFHEEVITDEQFEVMGVQSVYLYQSCDKNGIDFLFLPSCSFNFIIYKVSFLKS